MVENLFKKWSLALPALAISLCGVSDGPQTESEFAIVPRAYKQRHVCKIHVDLRLSSYLEDVTAGGCRACSDEEGAADGGLGEE